MFVSYVACLGTEFVNVQGYTREEIINKIKNVFSDDRRAYRVKTNKDKAKTGEGVVSASDLRMEEELTEVCWG